MVEMQNWVNTFVNNPVELKNKSYLTASVKEKEKWSTLFNLKSSNAVCTFNFPLSKTKNAEKDFFCGEINFLWKALCVSKASSLFEYSSVNCKLIFALRWINYAIKSKLAAPCAIRMPLKKGVAITIKLNYSHPAH